MWVSLGRCHTPGSQFLGMVVNQETERQAPPLTAPPLKAPPLRMRKRPPCRDAGGDDRSRELAASMASHSQAICASHRALLGDIAAFDLTESWRGDGAVSMAAWLTERCKVSSTTAATWVRAATKLESLPHLARALAQGALSLDAVAPLAEVAQPDTDADLASAAVHWTVKQVRELAASHRGTTDSAAARQFEHRTLRFNDAKATMFAAFTKDDYARAKAAMIARVSWDGGGAGRGRHGQHRGSGQ